MKPLCLKIQKVVCGKSKASFKKGKVCILKH